MKYKSQFEEDGEFYHTEQIDEIVVINFKNNLFHHAIDIGDKDRILNFLDRVSKNDLIKVIVIIYSLEKTGCNEYLEFFNQIIEHKSGSFALHRLCNAIDQFILKLLDTNKVIVNAISGNVISMFLNMSLACDYRIAADDAVFQNPYLQLGLIPKGGGAFFLSKKLGIGRAYEILLSGTDISVQKALRLGVVDKIVPKKDLYTEALNIAYWFAQRPAQSLAGIKKLMNLSLDDLKKQLELETEEIIRLVGVQC
jgi:enoyl-CoA hydratase/carnithine racemase